MILVNGGTGFIGKEIVKKLIEEGKEVRILSRNPEKGKKKLNLEPIDWIKGDVLDKISLKNAFYGVDTVINCVQFPNHPVEVKSKGWTYMNIDAEGTKAQVEIADEMGVKHFIYLSGAGVGQELNYTWFKAKEIAENAIKASKMEFTIFRPSWIYGPKDRSLNKFISFIRYLPFVPVIGTGKEKIKPVFIDDIASIVISSINNNQAKNKIIEIGGPEELSMDEMILKIQKILKKTQPILHHPVYLMKLAAFFIYFLPNPFLSPSAVDFITMEVSVDNSALIDILKPNLTSFEDGVKSYIL